jgi:hypothetical protein
MSLSSSTNISTYLCYIEGPLKEALAVIVIFSSPSNQIMNIVSFKLVK